MDKKPLVRSVLLRNQVYNLLRSHLLQGKYPPGTHLVEDELAEQLGASRTPIREAMHRLMVEGLVVQSEGRGLRVADVGQEDMKEAMDIRLLLEKYAVNLAARYATAEEIAELRATCLQEQEYLHQNHEKYLDEITQLNRKFHEQLVNCSHNRMLNYVVSQLLGNVLYRLFALGEPENLKTFAASHLKLVEAIERHDAEAAEKEITYHIGLMGNILKPEKEGES